MKDNTLNLTLNNNVEKGNEIDVELSPKPRPVKHKPTEDSSPLDKKKAKRKSSEFTTTGIRLPSTKKRKSSFSSGSSISGSEKPQQDEEEEDEDDAKDVEKKNKEPMQVDNPYIFIDSEDPKDTSAVSKPPKSKKIKKENNNEIETGEQLSAQQSKKQIKTSIAKVKSETNNYEERENMVEEEDDEGSEMLNVVSEPDTEEQAQEC